MHPLAAVLQCREQLALAGDIHSQLSRLQSALQEHKRQQRTSQADAEHSKEQQVSHASAWQFRAILCTSFGSAVTAYLNQQVLVDCSEPSTHL